MGNARLTPEAFDSGPMVFQGMRQGLTSLDKMIDVCLDALDQAEAADLREKQGGEAAGTDRDRRRRECGAAERQWE